MKIRSKQLKIDRIRINKAGCLDRCELGPVLVIYPEAIWYRFDTSKDIDEILERHIIGGETVDRLVLGVDQKVLADAVKRRLRLRVANVETLALNIKKFQLTAEDQGLLPKFTAGSHIDIFTGNGLRRSYSLAGDPNDRKRYVIAVLRDSESRGGSDWIHDCLAVGDIVEASTPENNFPLDETATEHLLIAGGIGIAPLMSMGWRLKDMEAQATLHYSAASQEATAFSSDVKEAFGDRVTIYHDGGDPARGIDLGVVLADPAEGACLYICGPSAMIDAARRLAAHWPIDRVRFEKFSVSPQDLLETPNQAFDIVLSRQGKTLQVPPDKSILDVLKEAGVEVESSCEEGICGTCRIKLLSGKVDHGDKILKEREGVDDAEIMICSSRAEPGEILILDI